jgi:hypothetical protein
MHPTHSLAANRRCVQTPRSRRLTATERLRRQAAPVRRGRRKQPAAAVLLGAILLAAAGTASAHRFPASRALPNPQSLPRPTAAPARCPAGLPVQTITVVNQANVRPRALEKVELAVTDQSMQLRAAWGTPCVQFAPGGWAFTLTPGAPTVNPDGSVSTTIGGHHYYVGTVVSAAIQTGGTTYQTWARAFTHEVDEALVDPTDAVRWRFGLLEVCDPVEDWTYTLDGVQVSDFVLPSYFSGGPGPWDQAGALSGPSAFS